MHNVHLTRGCEKTDEPSIFGMHYSLDSFRWDMQSSSCSGCDNATTGFSPLAFDMKVHLWDDMVEILRPAASLEVYIQTDWASSAFRGGTQPGLALNFDLPLSKKLNLEWTIAYSGVQDVVDVATGQRFTPTLNNNDPLLLRENLNEYRFSFLWAVERKVTEKLLLFVHGYYNGAILYQQGSGDVIGGGFFRKCSKSVVVFGSCNAGLNQNVPPISGLTGIALAF